METLLTKLRDCNWSVAVHNDYRLNGLKMTFWLLTHPTGMWVKGEGSNDLEALQKCLAAVKHLPVTKGGLRDPRNEKRPQVNLRRRRFKPVPAAAYRK